MRRGPGDSKWSRNSIKMCWVSCPNLMFSFITPGQFYLPPNKQLDTFIWNPSTKLLFVMVGGQNLEMFELIIFCQPICFWGKEPLLLFMWVNDNRYWRSEINIRVAEPHIFMLHIRAQFGNIKNENITRLAIYKHFYESILQAIECSRQLMTRTVGRMDTYCHFLSSWRSQ